MKNLIYHALINTKDSKIQNIPFTAFTEVSSKSFYLAFETKKKESRISR